MRSPKNGMMARLEILEMRRLAARGHAVPMFGGGSASGGGNGAVKTSSSDDDDDGVMMGDDGCDIFWVVARKLCSNVAKIVFEFSKFLFYLSKSPSIALCGFTV